MARGEDAAALLAQAPLPAPEEYADDLRCVESENDAFTVANASEACFRVLWSNPPTGPPPRRQRVAAMRERMSLLGVNGHVERANAWTHIVGGIGFFAFGVARAVALGARSVADRTSTAAAFCFAVTFGVSVSYHTLGSVRKLSPLLRTLDHASIAISLGVASVADAAVATASFRDAPWTTVADPCFVTGFFVLIFLVRRCVVPADETETGFGDCRLGLFRVQHSDTTWGALRSCGYLALTFVFVMIAPVAVRSLEAGALLVALNAVSLALLISGIFLDNVLLIPDRAYEFAARRRGPGGRASVVRRPPVPCHSKSCGCVITSHAAWHVVSLVACALITAGRENAIQRGHAT